MQERSPSPPSSATPALPVAVASAPRGPFRIARQGRPRWAGGVAIIEHPEDDSVEIAWEPGHVQRQPLPVLGAFMGAGMAVALLTGGAPLVVGAGVGAAALAALLFAYRRRSEVFDPRTGERWTRTVYLFGSRQVRRGAPFRTPLALERSVSRDTEGSPLHVLTLGGPEPFVHESVSAEEIDGLHEALQAAIVRAARRREGGP